MVELKKNNLLFREIKIIKFKKIILNGGNLKKKIKIKNLFLITIKY